MGNRATKGLKRLKARQRAFDEHAGTVGDRPNDKWITTMSGKYVLVHRPGSKKR
jgi:hypothetical protein